MVTFENKPLYFSIVLCINTKSKEDLAYEYMHFLY
jgi:hypothetical protein